MPSSRHLQSNILLIPQTLVHRFSFAHLVGTIIAKTYAEQPTSYIYTRRRFETTDSDKITRLNPFPVFLRHRAIQPAGLFSTCGVHSGCGPLLVPHNTPHNFKVHIFNVSLRTSGDGSVMHSHNFLRHWSGATSPAQYKYQALWPPESTRLSIHFNN